MKRYGFAIATILLTLAMTQSAQACPTGSLLGNTTIVESPVTVSRF